MELEENLRCVPLGLGLEKRTVDFPEQLQGVLQVEQSLFAVGRLLGRSHQAPESKAFR